MPNRQAVLRIALQAYEDALIRGLCPAGAFDVAIASIPPVEPAVTIDELNLALTAADGDIPAIRIKPVYDPPAAQDGVCVPRQHVRSPATE